MVFRKKQPDFPPRPAQPQFPTASHLRTSFTAAFKDGSTFEFFVIPEWKQQPGLPVVGKVVQYLPKPGDRNVLLQNGAKDYLEFALGVTDGFTSDDGDYELPGIAMLESDQRIADRFGIDPFEWVVHECKWTPNAFRDMRTGSRRIFDEFGLEEEVVCSVYGVLRDGLWQSTYHLSNRALYIFGESHEDSKARIPLELFLSSARGPSRNFGPGDFQATFYNPGSFDFGKLPKSAVFGKWSSEDGTGSIDVLSIGGFKVAKQDAWSKLRKEISYNLCNILPTKRLTVRANGDIAEIDLSKTIRGGGNYVFADRNIQVDVARRLSKTDEMRRVIREGLAGLDSPEVPNDLTNLESLVASDAAVVEEPVDTSQDNLLKRLKRLDEMLDQGVISEEEHSRHRERLLNEV